MKRPPTLEQALGKGGSKFGNKRTTVAGITFDSKKEATYYLQLKARHRAGEVTMFLRQVPIELPGGVKYVVDFVEFLADGSVAWVDVKGHRTDTYKLKKRQVESLYPFTITEA
ncbi:DUF1064 domain-containing protein [Salinicola corii]|uniref:DUF1064 domain-containing protein n=1 Tax=Salinicola corii TaxID=2606937 RepID=A0A640W8Z7_9GAMM|nr:DUF1064 domain-containing protein [Salinicola corii]KAA0015486.1 DUF1064 domain-containing protein [Salinicola corii]